MDVTVKLYSFFRIKYDDYNSKTGIRAQIEKGSTIYDLLKKMEIELKHVSIVRVNGEIVRNLNKSLNDEDTIDIFPLYGGG